MTWQSSLAEMASRWAAGLERPTWLGVEAGLGALALSVLLVIARAKPLVWKAAAVLFALLAAGWAAHLALAQAWIADDAFISFRYARNFAEGNGLVWNLGERVEGYTNFLWTLLLGIAIRVGVSPALGATAMTLGSLGALALVSALKLSRPRWIPLAPVLLVLSPAFIEFGTSGLEAAPAAVCIGFCALWLVDDRRTHLAGWWVLIAALLRPDHALFFAPLGALQLFASRLALRHTLGAGLAFVVYWLGRWAYFGDFFPNTFHAKSGGGAYWTQGGLYWAEFSLATGVALAIPLVLVVAAILRLKGRSTETVPRAAVAFCFAGAALFAVYVARVGGDFMEFRFGLTAFILFALGADALLSGLAGGRAWATVLACIALLPLGLAPRIIKDGEKKWHLARESSFYRVKSWSPLEIESGAWRIGQSLAGLPEQGAHAPPIAAGCIGMMGYLSRVPIIDVYGLTNAVIARKPIKERGRPGHEKVATKDELMAQGAQWSVDPGWEGPLESATRFRVGMVDYWVLRHTAALAAAVRLPVPREVLSSIRSPEEAARQHEAVSTLYAELPEVLEQWRNQWELVDARTVEAEGHVVERTASRVTAQDRLKLRLRHACPTPQRLKWTVTRGTCSSSEVRCESAELDSEVTCTGPEIRIEGFTLQALDVGARLRRALPLGADALAGVVRSEDDAALPDLVARIHFDGKDDLARPGLEQTGKVFDVTGAPVSGQGVITGMHGGGLLNGFAWGDQPKGRLRISVPVEPGTPLLFSVLFAGGSACDRIYALLLDGDQQLDRICAHQDEVLRSFAKVVKPRTDHLVLEVVDTEDAAWGHALLDDLLVWRIPTSP